jgi:hypothetical protein
MAKKQTRRSISVSRVTYERLKAFCEANNISMSQFVEHRVGEALPTSGNPEPSRPVGMPMTPPPRPTPAPMPMRERVIPPVKKEIAPTPAIVPMTSAAVRLSVDPPPPVLKPKQEQAAPKPVEKRAEQIFTF